VFKRQKLRSDIAWLAGLIEGEGSFFKRPPTSTGARSRWCFTLEMTDEDVVRKAAATWGYGSVRKRCARQRPQAFGTKDLYVWRFEDRGQVYALLSAIYPWLGERRGKKAAEALKNLPPTPSLKRGPKKRELARAEQLRDSGCSYREIASILGCSYSTIQRCFAQSEVKEPRNAQ